MHRVSILIRHGQSIVRSLPTSTSKAANIHLFRPAWSNYEKQTKPHILELYRTAWEDTNDPTWPFILAMKSPNSDELASAMAHDSGLALPSHIRWREFLDSGGLVEVASRIDKTLDPATFPSIAQMPTWALSYLLTFRVTDPSDARAAVKLVIARIFSRCDRRTIPVLLTLSVHALADHQVADGVHKVAELFLGRRRLPSQYGLFLHALSRFPPSRESSAMISAIVEKMHKDEGEVPENIYVSLLKSNSSSVPLARRLERLLLVTNIQLSPRLFHAFFRVYSRHGATALAIKHLPSIFQAAVLSEPDGALLYPSGSSTPTDGNSSGLRFEVDGGAVVANHLKPGSLTKGHSASVSPGTKYWTSVLAFFSASRNISADQLIKLFNRFRKIHPPTTISFTVLMRALLSREAYQLAIDTWHEMLAEGHPMDTKSLSAMIEACILSGKLWDAFYVLEVVAGGGPHGATPRPISEDCQSRIRLTPAFLAMFMKGLAHSGRPDVAFIVWDHAELLYGVTPDASVLSVLLEIARAVLKHEETFAGFWANLRAKRSTAHLDNLSSSSFHVLDREEVVESLRLTLSNDTRKKRRPTGLWGDVPAWQKAIKIFYHAVLGNNPELLHALPPATAIRTSADDMHHHPWVEFIRSIQGPSPLNEVFRDVDVNSPASLARLGLYPLQAYPKIIPKKATFHNQIYLLGMCGQASQIPMVLAWMKELKIIPFGRTTAMALIFWAEVSLRAPLFEQFGGEGEYSRLLKWLGEWLGEGRMPGQARMTRMSKVIAKAREGQEKIRR